MTKGAKLHINDCQIDLDYRDLDALRDRLISRLNTVDYELNALEIAQELVGRFGSLDEAVSAKQAQQRRLTEKIDEFDSVVS